MSTALLRDASAADLPAISEIYNYYVLHSTCTYQLEPETLADRQAWFNLHSSDKYPVVVAQLDGRVRGWGSLSKFHPRAGYAPTVEASVYIADGFHRRGLGRMLLEDLIARARRAGFHSLIGGASADQPASIALQESLGFTRVAHFKEVGQKFGRRLDVIYLQLML
jgi:L-amino acid N-acyltransferase YncA